MDGKQFKAIMSKASDEWIDAMIKAMEENGINTPLRQAAFLAQIAHESSELTHLEENLNYSAERLMVVFPKKFSSLEFAKQYDRSPEKIANYIYANRMGNGDEQSGDGYKFRGRCPIQLTGKYNYEHFEKISEKDIVNNPDILKEPETGSLITCLFWNDKGLSPLADVGDFETITRRINGGLIGYDARLVYYTKAKEVLNVA
jgi:putative chitinase